jgi:hypothetical protein
MIRISIVTMSALLIALVFVFGTTEENQSGPKSIVMSLLESTNGRQLSYLMESGYALDVLAMPYIKDQVLVNLISKRGYCGTTAGWYLSRHPEPPEEFLKNRAANIEVRLRREL